MGKEEIADKYAEDKLIPPLEYQEFLNQNHFEVKDTVAFVKKIGRDPGIVLGQLENDEIVGFDKREMKRLKHRYRIITE